MAHVIAVIVNDGISPFEMSIAAEVFGLDRSDLGVPWYEFRLCAGSGQIATTAGFAVEVPYGLDRAVDADTVVVPATARDARRDEGTVAVLRAAARRGARTMSFCTGAFALAEAGLLDGRRATTHWMYTDEFRSRYPRVRLDPNVLYVDDGDVLTSAGTAAGIDLALHVVGLDFGAEIANAVARRMVVSPHRDGGQAQFVEGPRVPRVAERGAIARLLDGLRHELDEHHDVRSMAARVAMSPRTFARRFSEATGTTPARWLVVQRVEHARRLLETTDLDVELIAGRCGLGSGTTLRSHFRRELGLTPTAYRRSFARRAPARHPAS